MSVELEPAELGFKRPFTQEVSQVLRLRNNNSDPVAFKVKTTAPKQYCVRPNSGRIEPGEHVEVQVLLQAMKEDPPLDAKCRDKFLVQSVAVTGNSDSNVSQIWSNIEQNAKSSVQEKKIRVNFLPADSSASGASGLSPSTTAAAGVAAGAGGAATAAAASTATTNGVSSHDESPPAYSSPAPSARGGDRSMVDATETSAAETSTLAATASSIGLPTSQEQLQAQLTEAKAQITRLQAQVSEGIRQRKPQEAAEKAINNVQQSLQNGPAPGGVPIQIVAALCLLCFIIAWLFF